MSLSHCPIVLFAHMVTSAADWGPKQSILHSLIVHRVPSSPFPGCRGETDAALSAVSWNDSEYGVCFLPCAFRSVWMPAAHGSAIGSCTAWNCWMNPSPRWWPQSESGFRESGLFFENSLLSWGFFLFCFCFTDFG